MKRRKVRCFKTLAHVAPNIFNYPVFFLVYEGWSNFSFATCINCGELFVVDWENPKTKDLTLEMIASSSKCPTCNNLLKEFIRNYPEYIKLSNGQLGSFIPNHKIPPDHESLIIEFFEIEPKPI
jgi:hypothetical protein